MTKQIEFDCGVSEPINIVVTPVENKYDPEQNITIVQITPEGLIIDFYTDGDIVGSIAKTWQEWWDEQSQ